MKLSSNNYQIKSLNRGSLFFCGGGDFIFKKDAVWIISNYISEHLFIGNSNWPDSVFKKRCYARWAAYEIMKRIANLQETEPLIIILDFWNQMSELSTVREDSDAELIFVTARDTANELLTLF